MRLWLTCLPPRCSSTCNRRRASANSRSRVPSCGSLNHCETDALFHRVESGRATLSCSLRRREISPARKQSIQRTGKIGGDMYHNQNGSREIGRQVPHDCAQSANAPCGTSNDHNVAHPSNEEVTRLRARRTLCGEGGGFYRCGSAKL